MKFVLYIVFVLYFQIVRRDAAAYVATRWLCYVRLCHKQKTELQRQKAESSSVYILTQGGGGCGDHPAEYTLRSVHGICFPAS